MGASAGSSNGLLVGSSNRDNPGPEVDCRRESNADPNQACICIADARRLARMRYAIIPGHSQRRLAIRGPFTDAFPISISE
jgi:hypothetical protein